MKAELLYVLAYMGIFEEYPEMVTPRDIIRWPVQLELYTLEEIVEYAYYAWVPPKCRQP